MGTTLFEMESRLERNRRHSFNCNAMESARKGVADQGAHVEEVRNGVILIDFIFSDN
jgi:hypothetical protein